MIYVKFLAYIEDSIQNSFSNYYLLGYPSWHQLSGAPGLSPEFNSPNHPLDSLITNSNQLFYLHFPSCLSTKAKERRARIETSNRDMPSLFRLCWQIPVFSKSQIKHYHCSKPEVGSEIRGSLCLSELPYKSGLCHVTGS